MSRQQRRSRDKLRKRFERLAARKERVRLSLTDLALTGHAWFGSLTFMDPLPADDREMKEDYRRLCSLLARCGIMLWGSVAVVHYGTSYGRRCRVNLHLIFVPHPEVASFLSRWPGREWNRKLPGVGASFRDLAVRAGFGQDGSIRPLDSRGPSYALHPGWTKPDPKTGRTGIAWRYDESALDGFVKQFEGTLTTEPPDAVRALASSDTPRDVPGTLVVQRELSPPPPNRDQARVKAHTSWEGTVSKWWEATCLAGGGSAGWNRKVYPAQKAWQDYRAFCEATDLATAPRRIWRECMSWRFGRSRDGVWIDVTPAVNPLTAAVVFGHKRGAATAPAIPEVARVVPPLFGTG